MRYIPLSLSFLLTSTNLASAHMGHLGDLAGHSHWVGVGLILVGGAAAIWLGKGKKKPDEESEAEVTDAEEKTA